MFAGRRRGGLLVGGGQRAPERVFSGRGREGDFPVVVARVNANISVGQAPLALGL